MNLVNTISNSWKLLKQSASFLNKNRDLIFFPVISLIASLGFLVLTLFSGILEFSFLKELADKSPFLLIPIIAIVYFALAFITIYFNASLVACATLRLQGKDASIGDGLGLAGTHWWPLLQWAILTTTVGFIIRALEKSHSMVEEIIGMVLGLGWTVGAYFVLPIVVLEDVGPFKALKRGFSIFGRGWKKVVAVNLIFGLIGMGLFAIIYGIAHLIPANETTHLIEFAVFLFVVMIIFMATVGSAFNAIVTSGLYLTLVKGEEPAGFSHELASQAFTHK